MEAIYLRTLDTKIGILTLCATERGICRIGLPGVARERILDLIEKSHGPCEYWDEDVSGKKSL